MPLSLTDYAVLDALANDLESLEDIVRLVNHPDMGWQEEHGGAFAQDEVVAALISAILNRAVEAFEVRSASSELEPIAVGVLPTESLDECWFGLTEAGRALHSSWQPPTGPVNPGPAGETPAS